MKQKSVNNRIRGCYILIGLSVINGAYSMNGSVSLYNYISGKRCGAASYREARGMCDGYENLNNSAVQSKKIVAGVKAFLDAYGESDGEVELTDIETGRDVYHFIESVSGSDNNTDVSLSINGLERKGLVKRPVNKKAEEKPKQEEKKKAAAVQPQQDVVNQPQPAAGTTNSTPVQQKPSAPQKKFRGFAPGAFGMKQPEVKEMRVEQPVQQPTISQQQTNQQPQMNWQQQPQVNWQQQPQTAPTVATKPQPAAGTTNSTQTQKKPVKFSPGFLGKK